MKCRILVADYRHLRAKKMLLDPLTIQTIVSITPIIPVIGIVWQDIMQVHLTLIMDYGCA